MFGKICRVLFGGVDEPPAVVRDDNSLARHDGVRRAYAENTGINGMWEVYVMQDGYTTLMSGRVDKETADKMVRQFNRGDEEFLFENITEDGLCEYISKHGRPKWIYHGKG